MYINIDQFGDKKCNRDISDNRLVTSKQNNKKKDFYNRKLSKHHQSKIF
jgi:hypothetical protein